MVEVFTKGEIRFNLRVYRWRTFKREKKRAGVYGALAFIASP